MLLFNYRSDPVSGSVETIIQEVGAYVSLTRSTTGP